MSIHGQFVFKIGGKDLVVPNTITDEGEQTFLKMIGRADVADVAAGGNFYVGLCSEIPGEADTLADITTELGVAGAYARQAFTRDATGFPNLVSAGDAYKLQSKQLDFTAVGAGFSTTFERAFLCNVLSGSIGLLFAYSGILPDPVQVLIAETFSMRYELFLR